MVSDIGISVIYENTKLLLPLLPQNDNFLLTIRSVFHFARWFGVPTFGGVISLLWSIFQICMLMTIEGGALWKLGRAISGVATEMGGDRSIIGRLSGTIFYGNAIISLILSWRLAASWKSISVFWMMTERTTALYLPADVTLKRRLTIIIIFVVACSIVEHALSMMSATGFDFPPSEFFQRYILTTHGFLLRSDEYSLWFAVPLFVLSKTATCLWNFQDSIIILLSIGLTSRYRRLNSFVQEYINNDIESQITNQSKNEEYSRLLKWRRIREAYVQQAALVRRIDNVLGSLILLSNFNNFYFICLQLFFGIGGERPSFINKVYYIFSTFWLCFRAITVVMAAADVNVHSSRILRHLHAYPLELYNSEVERLEKQLCKDHVALSGMGFFYLDRTMLLQVAAAILTYELVLLQYDSS